ncbi:PIG-L family deacetylase [Brevibacterium sp. PAMC23299]|nr:PIG-L family deacetylase [Brevibacterium sp. PAMC23299]
MLDKLMVVAHPDDESIFGGATLLREKGWKVICLTNGENETRSNEFSQAMNMIGASFEIWDYPDELEGTFDADQLKTDLKKVFRMNRIKRIVTHNLNGEYGHSQHKSLSRILHDLVCENLYVFDKSDQVLPFHLLKKKLRLLSVYQSQMEGNIKQLMQYVIHERVVLSTENKNKND